jgi:hypothetical protein
MSVFDNVLRTYTGPADYAEESFSFFNRSAREEVGRVRDLIEAWVADYPAAERSEIVMRLREDSGNFQSAFFELYVHHLLKRSGHEVELHPLVKGTTKRPDFLAIPTNGFSPPTYVEAVVAGGRSEAERTERALHDRIQDDINSFEQTEFLLIVAILEGKPNQYPARRLLHAFVGRILKGLDPEDVAERSQNGEDISRTLRRRFIHKGLTVEVYPIPKSQTTRGRVERNIAGGPIRVLRSNAFHSVRDAIKTKAGRYGELGRPYVIAVNCASEWGVEEIEVRQALLGREVVVFSDDEDPQFRYDGEGAFSHRSKPTNTRVSAVLAVRGLWPHSVPYADVALYHHIAPKLPYGGPLESLREIKLVDTHLEIVPGPTRHIGQLFDLHTGWPYGLDDPRGRGWQRVVVPDDSGQLDASR